MERIKNHNVKYLDGEVAPQTISTNDDIFDLHLDIEEALRDLWIEGAKEEWPKLLNRLSSGCVDSASSLVFNSSVISILRKIMPLLDASGKPGAGMLNGNFIYDGAFDECYSYNYTAFCYATGVTLVNHTLYPQWVLGLCVPKHCTGKDISYLINSTRMLQVSDQTVYCEDVKSPPYSTGAVIMLVITALFVAMVCIGTAADVLMKYLPLLFAKNGGSIPVNAGVDREDERKPLLKLGIPKRKNGVMPLDFLTAFSLLRTVPNLLATRQAESVITNLNGLRVISMFWVILCHTYFWIMSPGHVDNPIVMKGVLSRFSFQAIANGFFSVDSFFFLSGVLVAYLSLREMGRNRGRFPILHYYIHRYLRLTPVYAFILFFSWTLFGHLTTGPGFIAGARLQSGNCEKYWWTNLLYINNFYPWKSAEGTCIGWTWYLANDMQFYVISPLILIPMYFLFPVALGIVLILLVCSFAVTFALAGVYDFQANTFAPFAYNYTVDLTSPQYFDLVYQKPWSRIQPYLVGLLLGYVLYKKLRFRFGMKGNVLAYLLLWVVAGLIMIPDQYGLYFTFHGHVPSKAENVLYIGLSKFAWGLGLALIVFACHNGYGWFINSFLSMKMWTPLARMTYNAYLVHPIVLSVVYGQLQKSFHYTDVTISVFAVSFVVISYGIAAVVCVLVEFPLANIESLVFKLVGVRGRESLRQGIVAEAVNKEEKNGLQASSSLFSRNVA